MGSRIDQLFEKKYRQARYSKTKSEHRCTKCGKQDDRTLSGGSRCAACVERENAARREKRREIKNGVKES